MSSSLCRKIFVITILVLLGLMVTIQALGAPTKPEMVTLTKEQWDGLNNKLEIWAYGFLLFIAKELWDIFKNRGKNLADIEKSIEKMNESIKNLATKEYAREVARDEVLHARDLQR